MSSEFESETPPQAEGAVERLRIPLVYLFFAVAVLSATLALFGLPGILHALFILAFWAFVFASDKRPYTLGAAVMIYGMLAGAAMLGWMVFEGSRSHPAVGRPTCQKNLRMLAMTVAQYHDQYGSFPPAYVADANGTPMHSWRVLILPYLEQANLYKAYKFDEPWNGPNNALLAARMPPEFQCPAYALEPGTSVGVPNYLAVVGPNTAWSGANALAFDDMKDNWSTTLLLVESHDANMNWLEPRDISGDEVAALLSDDTPKHGTHHARHDFLYEHTDNGRMVAFVSLETRYLGGLEAATAQALVDRTDGHAVTKDALEEGVIRHSTRPRYANWFRLSCFVLIVHFPLPWVWIHPAGPRAMARGAAQVRQ